VIRRRAVITGVVQGVGFRPHVARVAARFPLTGFCGNDDVAVFVEAQGRVPDVAGFLAAVRTEAPPLARIAWVEESDLPVVPGEVGFAIVPSRRVAGAVTLISPDVATCDDCLREMRDPGDRRYGYPFINCTNCGPRLSIIRDVPYDRPLTTMADFPMCPACRAEYEDPADRRYHAQPISCWDCGPLLWLETPPAPPSGPPPSGPPSSRKVNNLAREVNSAAVSADGASVSAGQRPVPDGARSPRETELTFREESGTSRQAVATKTFQAARAALAEGKILAVKGIGGFTIMCDARNAAAVAELRRRKRRPAKPLAVMAGSPSAARRLAILSDSQLNDLTSAAAPIVLAPMAPGYDLAAEVAPGLDEIGLMLPYAPVHHLLLAPDDVLVATSANSSSLPLTYLNEDADRDLAFVDLFLTHNRPIHVPVEDSVLGGAGPVRRSRGYAPLPVRLGQADHAVLAVGAELKNTFALVRDGLAFMSAHIGDMGSLETQAAFEKSVAQMLTMHRRRPEVVVCDKHPGYATRAWAERWAERTGVVVLPVQHHHAHALSLLAETQGGPAAPGRPAPPPPPSTYLVLDGTGYGDDATIWGGELLTLGQDPLDYRRAWHLPGFWLPGGDSAIKHPWKCALALLHEYGLDPAGLPPALAAPAEEFRLVRSQLDNQVTVVRTTSAGRLFDAVASLIGLRHTVLYEAQAAMELEATARRCQHREPGHPSSAVTEPDPLAALVRNLVEGIHADRPPCCLARAFQAGFAAICAEAAHAAAAPGAAIGLTGGVACNRLLVGDLTERLANQGHPTVTHHVVPANDGGLALGQALAGYLTLESGAA
jgi:hydrogenase maturation protein HypF